MSVALAMDDHPSDDSNEDTDLYKTDENCKTCHGNGWVYDPEDGGTMCCPDCESE